MDFLQNIEEAQFFKKSHYVTFEFSKISQNTKEILAERKDVQSRLLELHDILYPHIQRMGWDLHQHNSFEHRVSGIDIENPFIPNVLKSIWLHYGKHPTEITKYQKIVSNKSTETFIHHTRMQVILYNHCEKDFDDFGLGTWLVLGKNNGSFWDRNYFKEKMKKESYRTAFFNLIKQLDGHYFVQVNGLKRQANSFENEDDLRNFTFEKNYKNYFIIGKGFNPDDVRISSDNITETILKEFKLLYPIFQHTRHIIKS